MEKEDLEAVVQFSKMPKTLEKKLLEDSYLKRCNR
jgi:hypothetical protein